MQPAARSTDTPTILIVEDERETADLYTEMLEEEYEVITTYNGEEALKQLNPAIDVALLDRRLPDIHGDEVLAEIRERQLDCRVVMVTAVDPNVDVIGMDFDDYLVKPVSHRALVDAVERMLMRKSHDAIVQEAFAIASKMATLESKMDIEDLESSSDYAELEERFKEIRHKTEDLETEKDLYEELATVKMQALFDAA